MARHQTSLIRALPQPDPGSMEAGVSTHPNVFSRFRNLILNQPLAVALSLAALQVTILTIGWVATYFTTHESVAKSVQDIIIQNNTNVAESLISAIGDLPGDFNQSDPRWEKAQTFVEQVELGSGGFACILDAEGQIVCHPEIRSDPSLQSINLGSQLFTPLPIADKPEPASTPLHTAGQDQLATGTMDFMFEGKHYIATQQINESGARLLVHQPVSGLTTAREHVTYPLLITLSTMGLLLISITGFTTFWFTRAHSRAALRWNQALDQKVKDRTHQLSVSRKAIVFALAKLAEYRDNETGQHVERICAYSRIIATQLHSHPETQDPAWIDQLEMAASLHDIGKVAVPDHVLHKPGKLTYAEFEQIKLHASVGAEALTMIRNQLEGDDLLSMGIDVTSCHHEKWDGSGYPNGLSGEAIPLSARIVAVADVFDALLSKRVYKPAMPLDKVVAIINESSGNHFDPQIVDAFNTCIDALVEARTSHMDQPEALNVAA